MISRSALSCSHWWKFVCTECHHDIILCASSAIFKRTMQRRIFEIATYTQRDFLLILKSSDQDGAIANFTLLYYERNLIITSAKLRQISHLHLKHLRKGQIELVTQKVPSLTRFLLFNQRQNTQQCAQSPGGVWF